MKKFLIGLLVLGLAQFALGSDSTNRIYGGTGAYVTSDIPTGADAAAANADPRYGTDWSVYPSAGNPLGCIVRWYSVKVHGGSASTVYDVGADIPAGTILLGGFLETLTPLTPLTATNASLGVNAAADLCADMSKATTNGTSALVPVFTAATAITATNDSPIKLTVTSAATQGVFRLVIPCIYGSRF